MGRAKLGSFLPKNGVDGGAVLFISRLNKRAHFSCSFAHRTPPPSTITDNKEMWIAQFHLPYQRTLPPLTITNDNKEKWMGPVSLTASAGCETLSWRALLEMDGWRMSVSSEAVSLIPHILEKTQLYNEAHQALKEYKAVCIASSFSEDIATSNQTPSIALAR